MFRTRFLSCLTALCCLVGLAGTAAAAEVDCDSVYCFSAEDFSGETSIAGICITDLPDNGTLLLGSRVLREGDVLTADQAAQMTCSPSGPRRIPPRRWDTCPFTPTTWRTLPL